MSFVYCFSNSTDANDELLINKKMINKIKIKNGDKIEIVHFIGGG